MKKLKSKTIEYLFSYLKNVRFSVILTLVLSFVNVLCTLFVPILFGKAIDLVTNDADKVLMVRYLMIALVIICIAAICQYVQGKLNNDLSIKIVSDIREDAFSHLNKLPLRFYDKGSAGDIISRVIYDCDQLSDGLLMGFTQLFSAVMTVVGTIIFMATLNVYICIAVVVITPLSLFASKFITKKTYVFFTGQSKIRGNQTSVINESFNEVSTIKAYGVEPHFIERFNKVNDELAGISLKALFYSSLTNPVTRFVNSVVFAAVALLGAILCVKGLISVGILACFLNYATQYTKPFNEISGVITELSASYASAKRIFELLSNEAEKPDDDKCIEMDMPRGDVHLKDVTFSYDKSKRILDNINISVRAGERVAIVGPTGCGKTTLINLLMRFYDPDGGSIFIDGKPSSDYTKHSLRDSVGMVLQDTSLISGTIRDNICMGREASDEELINCAKLTHAHSFIKRLENGYDTVVSEGNELLSQGEKQLICITRVMLKRPSILILDEATSSVDLRLEIKVQDAFNKLMENRTSFVVAHRLSTIVNSDLIVAMDMGKIMEMGSHEELMNKKGFYYNLYNSSIKGEE